MTKAYVSVQDFMSKKPIHINENDTISFVINMFDRTHISGAPVVNDQGEYVGIISKTDIASATLLRYAKELDTATVRQFMTHAKPLTLPLDAPLESAVELMLGKHVHRLFVEDAHGQIVGVISSFDILRAIQRTETSGSLEKVADKVVKASTGAGQPLAQNAKPKAKQPEIRETAPAASKPEEPEVESMASIKDKAERNREIEQRIFNLISKKQEQLLQENQPAAPNEQA